MSHGRGAVSQWFGSDKLKTRTDSLWRRNHSGVVTMSRCRQDVLTTRNLTAQQWPWIIQQLLTSSLWLSWKTVWVLWQSWAKQELRLVIFCRPSYVMSTWSGSISPRSRSTSTKALSNSFSSTSSHRNIDMPGPRPEPWPAGEHPPEADMSEDSGALTLTLA